MPDWLVTLAERATRGERAVLVTIAGARGSTPRESGTAMVVSLVDVVGTIGGGHLEFEAIRIARDTLSQSTLPAPWLVRFPLAARLGQCCGGVATLSFTVVAADSAPWLARAAESLKAGVPAAIVTRIGGTRDAHTVEARPDARASDATLAPSPDGDGTSLLVHTVVPERFHVLLFGNGHVGRALAQVLGVLPASVRWIDAREDDFPPSVPGNVEVVATDVWEPELAQAPAGAYVIVATHDHALDLAVVTAALRRDDWRYLGLIGSASKRSQFEKRLAARGFTASQLARITCPIGRVPGVAIRSKEPGAIAVAVAAELLAFREAAESFGKIGSDPISPVAPSRFGGNGV